LAGFSGADIIGICRRAYMMVIRESIEKEQKLKWQNAHNDLNAADQVYEIRRDHFEKATNVCQCSS
jgi:SpoVK/Ycf46/Vps4 family AAA+-type ATPase